MPKILVFDVETAPIVAYVWGLWENNVALNQIHTDWHLLSWSAKWLGDPASKIMYMDQRNAKDIEDDTSLLKGIWKLLDEADIVITQNGKNFDQKKLQARFLLNGMKPPSTYRHIDTLQIAKKHFAMTSNKLEYMSNNLCTKYKKLKTKQFQGFDLWKACLAGDLRAWREMEKYNKHDVLALEELYTKMIPWDTSINFNTYDDKPSQVCSCGEQDSLIKYGFAFTNLGKYQRYQCKSCGAETRSRQNLHSKDKRLSLKGNTNR